MRIALTAAAAALATATVVTGQSYVNFESPHVHPLDLTPDGSRLLAVNTGDNRLEVFAVDGATLVPIGAVAVGLEPVSVRARTDGEAWVVNHVSDTISIVDLSAMTVTATLATGDEPADVVFAGRPQRAFVSVSQLNQVKVYDPADLTAAPIVIDIEGEDPRALATDGTNVYAAIFESGNLTTILPQDTVSSFVNPYPGDQNPPPNSGAGFDPPVAGGLPAAPEVSLIVKRAPDGTWRDDNGGNWSSAVGWDLHDHDIVVIDAGSLSVSYVTGAMNANMGLAVSPAGQVLVVGTDAINDVRFEPNLNGIFVRVVGATFTGTSGPPDSIDDLNPHLDYATPTVPQNVRDQSIGDPRGIAWDGEVAYVTGMGSNNVIAVDGSLQRLDRAEVGAGPTGAAVNAAQNVLYVLNKFDASISIVDLGPFEAIETVAFHDATPVEITAGRPHLYGTHETSGLGQASCASCHIDARMDQVAWDLGDPSGAIKPFNQNCNGGIPGGGVCEDWHPMKGPMLTQTFLGIIGTEPFHWRGDRETLAAFNPAFEGLLGDDEQLDDAAMDEFIDFVTTLRPAPNPFRNVNSSLATALPNGGNALAGQTLFTTGNLDGAFLNCDDCHALPTGTNGIMISANLILETQSIKIPQMRNLYERTGFRDDSQSNNRGFGFIHDGSVPTLLEFLDFPGFTFSNPQQRLDVEAFMLSFTSEIHAGTGVQATVGGTGPDQTALRNTLLTLTGVRVIAKGVVEGEHRGYLRAAGDVWQSDRSGELATLGELDAAAALSPITYTVVPLPSGIRIGIDRDEDGVLDRDETDACSDPADPGSLPSPAGCADVNGDGVVDVGDLVLVVLNWGACPFPPPASCTGDTNGDGNVDVGDLVEVILNWT